LVFAHEDRGMPYHSKWQDLPTEAINPETLGIDRMSTLDIVDLISAEDRQVVAAVHHERDRIAVGVEIVVDALRKGGRLFLVGAGTSGRLGIVEAAEMPLTFGTNPGLVRAIMAGGQDAVFRTREGVEDNFEEGGRSVLRLRVSVRRTSRSHLPDGRSDRPMDEPIRHRVRTACAHAAARGPTRS
jgi:N-acetylmuramic acid 6-phosphate etherase